MTTNLSKVEIKPKSSAYPVRKMVGLTREGTPTDQFDFFKDSIREDWWDFFNRISLPNYNEDEVTYTIGIRSTYTCTGTDGELESRKTEYLRLGVEALLDFYDKQYDSSVINSLISDFDDDGTKIATVLDYHMPSRPSAKLKFLIEIDARYLNALPSNPDPISLSENVNNSNVLITDLGLLNPTVTSGGDLKSYDDISIVTISSTRFETEIEKTAFYMAQLHRDMISNSIKIKGINLINEAKRLRLVPALVQDLVAFNFSTDGYSTGVNLDPSYIPKPLRGEEYFIKFAIKEAPSGLFDLLWVTVLDDQRGEVLLRNGFERFLNSNPLDDQTTLRYFFFHQQILNTLDRNINLNFSDFLQSYHFPPVDVSGLIATKEKIAPFETKTEDLAIANDYNSAEPYVLETDPEKIYETPRKQCGFKFPDLPDFNLSFTDLLQQLLEPVSFNMELKLTFFSIGPPCPAPFTGDTLPAILKDAGLKFKRKLLNQQKVLERQQKEAQENFDYVGEYFTSETYLTDLETRFANPNSGFLLKMRQLGDLVLNQLSLDKLLKLVCICVAQIGDDLLANAGVELQVPEGSISIKSPGFTFDPKLLIDDPSQNFNMQQAFDANMGQFNMPAELKPFSLEQLCSFCITLPDILPKLPTFDLLKNLLDLLLALIEAILVQILTKLVLQLLKWLTRCPDFRCELRPQDAAADDYGNLNLDDFFPDVDRPSEIDAPLDQGDALEPTYGAPPVLANCPALFGISDAVPDLNAVQRTLFERISEELSSGELINVLEGYASQASVAIIKEIIETESEFDEIRPFITSYSKVEALIDCIYENADPQKVKNFANFTQDPQYCPDPSKNPAIYMRDKCDNDQQIERFLLRESASKAAKLKGIIDAIRVDPAFFESLIPDIFSTRDPESGELKEGLFADDKFKPPVLDTIIEQYRPIIQQINKKGRSEGPDLLKSMYQDGYPNTKIPNDDDLESQSISQLASAITLYSLGLINPVAGLPMQEVGKALSPYNAENEIDSMYPLVGGIQLKNALDNIESNTVAVSYVNTLQNGSASKFNGITIPSKSQRQFNGKIRLKYLNGDDAIEYYFESITDYLKNNGGQNGLQNHSIVRVKSPNLFTTTNYVGFGFEIPLDYDGIESTLEAITAVNNLDMLKPSQLTDENSKFYSPQGLVFSQLIERGSPAIFNVMISGMQDKFRQKVASAVHLSAFRDFVQVIGKRAQKSPYFKTYTYEDIKDGVGSSNIKTSSFKRFKRKDPYSTSPGFPTDDFRQKYRANDKNEGRTTVYWRPVPALEDTPLSHGRYPDGLCIEYINEENFINNVSENYNWHEYYDPSDPDENNLPPLSNAVLDEVLPELVHFYATDICLKAMPVTKIYKSNGMEEFRDNMFIRLISELILKDFDNLKIKEKFLIQLNKYYERRYKEDDSLTGSPPTQIDALNTLVGEQISGLEGAMKKASGLSDIAHLYEQDEKINIPAEAIIASGPDSNGLFFVPNLLLNDENASTIFSTPPISSKSTYKNVDEIKKGGFIFEAFFQIELHDETRDYLISRLGQEFVDNLEGVPLSFDNLDEDYSFFTPDEGADIISDVFFDDIKNNHIIKQFISFMIALDTDDRPSELKNITKVKGPKNVGLFKDVKFGVRFSYCITGLENVEEFFIDIASESDTYTGLFEELAGVDYSEPLKKEIIKNKSFLFTEGTNNILTFPIVTKYFNSSKQNTSKILQDSDLTSTFEDEPTASVQVAKAFGSAKKVLGTGGFTNYFYTLLKFSDLLKKFDTYFSVEEFNKEQLAAEFSKTNEWKALFNYSLPEALASNIVSVYSFLNLIEGLGNTKTFKGTKELYKLFFQMSLVRPDLSGKPAGGALEFDTNLLVPEDPSPPPIDENGNQESKEPPDNNNC